MFSEILDTIIRPAAILSEGIAAFSALFYYNKYKGKWMVLIPILLGYAFITEFSGCFYQGNNNNWGYNILAIITFTFYILTFYKTLIEKKPKNVIFVGLVIYGLAIIFNGLYISFFYESQLYSYFVGAVLLIVSILFYFVQLLRSPKVLEVKYDLFFWLGIGNLLFYVGYLPIKFVRNFIDNLNESLDLLFAVQLLLIIIMNICFTLGFIWVRKKK